MSLDHHGGRQRYFHERAKVEAQVGNPVRPDVSIAARERIWREIQTLAGSEVHGSFISEIDQEVERVLGYNAHGKMRQPEYLMQFLSMVEIGVEFIWSYRAEIEDVRAIQSLLADDLSAFRLRDVGPPRNRVFQIHLIDNPHLHSEIVDTTFELTREAAFASAQQDYAEAWTHYTRGDLDDAVVNAHKALESAMKLAIKRVDPTKTPENMQTNQLVPLLAQLDILPSRLQNLVVGLNQIFMNSGSLRNSAGTGHGSVDLSSPEATVALMALRLSGTLVSFLVDRYQQMKPTTTKTIKPKAAKKASAGARLRKPRSS